MCDFAKRTYYQVNWKRRTTRHRGRRGGINFQEIRNNALGIFGNYLGELQSITEYLTGHHHYGEA